MKIQSNRSFALGILALLVAVTLSVSLCREFVISKFLAALACWFLFAEAMYVVFFPCVAEKDVWRVAKAQAAYRARFGVFGPVMGYTPILIVFAGFALALVVTDEPGNRLLIVVVSMLVAAAEGRWLKRWLDRTLKESDKEHKSTSE